MKKFTVQAILLIIVIAIAIFLYSPKTSILSLPFFPQKPTVAELQINGGKLKVEIADTQVKRSKGLGGRQRLGENEGMLFIFQRLDKYPFWMKGLNFPLDFIWIKGDRVVDILENVPPPLSGQSDSSLPRYLPKVEVDKVLEVNSGTIHRLNIKSGDIIKLTKT